MARFDRYMLSQLLVLFGFFSLILVLVYWINRAVRLFDQLIADGQTAWVFLELTSLSLPSIIRAMLPVSAFVAAIYVTNRMASDSELTVVQATGYSPWRLARPVVCFGAIVALMMAVLTNLLVPLSSERLALRTQEVSQNMTARLLTPGEFLTPSDGVTFYIRDISPAGEMLDVFISEDPGPDRQVTYTASRAYLVRTDKGPQLVLVSGLVQTLDRETARLTTTAFDDFVYDVGSLLDPDTTPARTVGGLSTPELLSPSPALLEEVGRTRGDLILRGHDRFGQAFLAFAAALVGFSALIVGGFSRFGLWRNMLLAVGLVTVMQVMDGVGARLAGDDARLWPLMYLAGATGVALSAVLLWIASRPAMLRPRRAAQGARIT